MSEKRTYNLPNESNSSFLLNLCDSAINDFDTFNFGAVTIQTHKNCFYPSNDTDYKNILVPKLKVVDDYIIVFSYNVPGSQKFYFSEVRDRILNLRVSRKSFRNFDGITKCFKKDCLSVLFAIANLTTLEDTQISINKIIELKEILPYFSDIGFLDKVKNSDFKVG